MGVIIYSFNLNISPNKSYGVLECDIVMLQNYMLMILSLKRGVICARPWSLIFLAGDKVRTCRKQWHSVEQFKNYMLLFVSTKRWKAEETNIEFGHVTILIHVTAMLTECCGKQ